MTACLFVDSIMGQIRCKKCGIVISDRETVCPYCGAPVLTILDDDKPLTVKSYVKGKAKKSKQKFRDRVRKNRNAIVSAIVGIALVVVLVFMVEGQAPNLEKVYKEIGGEGTCCILADDGQSLTFDTNPYDEADTSYGEAARMIQEANAKLKFPNSVLVKMFNTTEAQGIQKASNRYVTVTWSYYPKRGLEVEYKLK